MVYIASPLTTIGGDLAEIKSVSKVLEKINTVLSFPSIFNRAERTRIAPSKKIPK